MKFSTIVMTFGFAAFTIAASGTETSTSPAPTISLTPTQQCVAACPSGDVSCQAGCVGVPSPDASAVNATTDCAGKCVQGDGSAEATQKYSDCVQACISSNFLTTTGSPASAATSESATTTGDSTESGSSESSESASGTNTGNSHTTAGTGTHSTGSSSTPTGSGASASASGNSAPVLVTGGSFVGLFAMVAGILVL